MEQPVKPLFPAFERFVVENNLLAKEKGGALLVRLHRIMGQGRTRAVGLDLPPSNIERKMELTSLSLPSEWTVPESVGKEIEEVRQQISEEFKALKKADGLRRLATQTINRLGVPGGFKDNHYYAGHLVLVPKKRGENWSWSLTPYYPLVTKIPPDLDYLVRGYEAAEKILDKIVMPPDMFESRLKLSLLMARHFSQGDDVLIVNVARIFKVAGQRDQFWNAPQRKFFIDLPEAAFIANLLNWRRHLGNRKSPFEFVQATIHQALGPGVKVYYLPVNPEGTQVRPVVYLRDGGDK